MRIMKLLKIIEFHVRKITSMKIFEIFCDNSENYENHIIPSENYETNQNLKLINRIMKIMKTIEFNSRITKIIKKKYNFI